MSTTSEPKSHAEQIAQVVLKEAMALGVVAPLAAWALDAPMQIMAALTILFSCMAIGWEYCVNWAYEYLLRRYALRKTKLVRTQHALAIEVGLALMTVPILMHQLDLPLLEALAADLSLAAFYWVWTYGFYWVYDAVRPKLIRVKNSP